MLHINKNERTSPGILQVARLNGLSQNFTSLQLGLLLLIWISAVFAIYGQFAQRLEWVYVAKPLATLLIIALALSASLGSVQVLAKKYRKWIMTGLLASLVGDIFLMLPGNYFIQGLVSFLVAHLCYLRAFTLPAEIEKDPSLIGAPLLAVPLFVKPHPFFAYAVISAALLIVLFPKLPSSLIFPVIAYVLALALMAAQASARSEILKTRAARWAAVGGLFFVVSDATLAFNRFYAPVPWSPLWVLGTYWIAQTMIALSVWSNQEHKA